MKTKKSALLIAGSATGALNGLFGGGGGMIAVPALEGAAHFSALSAHATAIAVILPASIVSSIVYFFCGMVSLELLVPVAIGVTAGGVLGARLLPHISARTVTLIFAALMLAAGVRLLF